MNDTFEQLTFSELRENLYSRSRLDDKVFGLCFSMATAHIDKETNREIEERFFNLEEDLEAVYQIGYQHGVLETLER